MEGEAAATSERGAWRRNRDGRGQRRPRNLCNEEGAKATCDTGRECQSRPTENALLGLKTGSAHGSWSPAEIITLPFGPSCPRIFRSGFSEHRKLNSYVRAHYSHGNRSSLALLWDGYWQHHWESLLQSRQLFF